MGKRGFYWLWLSTAFRHSIWRGDGVAFLLGIAIPIARNAVPNWESVMNELTWQIPLGVFGSIVLVRLILAPYWLYKEKVKEINRLSALMGNKDESREKRQLKLDLGKLLLDGKEILMDLEKMDGQLDASGAVRAELQFEIWYKDVSKSLQNTDFHRLWSEKKEGVDYRTAKKSDFVEACRYGVRRLEYVMQLISDREGSQT